MGNFAILRINKIKSLDGLKAIDNHNTREMDVPHANEKLRHLNVQYKGSDDIKNDWQKRIDELGITKMRKNGVVAVELLMTASPEFFGADSPGYIPQPQSPLVQKWVEKCGDFLKDEFGKENIINVHFHLDEKTPHIHAVIVPVVQNHVRATKRRSDRLYEPYKLSSATWTDGREKMRALQDRFHQHLKPLGLERGVIRTKDEELRYTERASRANEELRKEKEKMESAVIQLSQQVDYLQKRIVDEKKAYDKGRADFTDFLSRMYHSLSNLDLSHGSDIERGVKALEAVRVAKANVREAEQKMRESNKKNKGFSM